ncbi:S8 family serine peptidase [uncultured Roseobacter sp.]|uniref:S8 family serine peptidase n=1 Tax=uncultured Roseobacter sp. TaxID=114847 RepID=UPI002611EBE9|nr:S8 family serine peptidase [uncultured Roseobacter sp.]
MLKYLFHIALTLLVIAALPLVSSEGPFSAVALADDDDGDDGDDRDDDRDDDDDDGPGNRGRNGNGATGGANPGGNLLDLLFGRTPPARTTQSPPPQPLPTRAADEIVVLDLSQEDLNGLLALGYEVLQVTEVTLFDSTLRRMRVPSGTPLETALEEIRQLPSGQAADFNHFYRMSEGFNTPCEGLHCTSFDLISWRPPASAVASCGQPTARIGLIDTDINPDHEAFIGSQLSVLDFDTGGLATSGAQHGTAVAAILIGSRTGRAHGLLPEAQLVAVDAFYTAGRDERSDAFNLVQAMDQLAEAQVDVINMSLAGPHNVLLEEMVAQMSDAQIMIVSAAGNDGPRAAPVFPGAYDPVLTVTAVDASGRVYRRAGRGPHVDLAAPGVEVWTAASVRGVRTKTGTSFAAPFATAAAAVLMSEQPDMTVAQVKAFLRETALDLGDEGPDEVFGAGLVQFAPICSGLPPTEPLLLE